MRFECEVSGNFLEYQESLDCVQLINSYIDLDSPKLFCNLLRESIEYYKEHNYIKLFQTVPYTEWEKNLSKNKKWTYIRKCIIGDIKCAIICCNINDAIECVAFGYGL